MNNYARWGLRLIGPALLAIFLWNTNFVQLAEAFRSIALWPVLLSLALMPAFIGVKAWRWSLLMRELDLRPPGLGYLMALYCIGLYYGGITPGQAGDFVKGWYLRERGLSLPPVLFSIVLDRLFDFLIMAVLAVLGVVALLDAFRPEQRLPVQVATYGFAALILLLTPLLLARRPRERLMNAALALAPRRLRPPIERWRNQFEALSLRPGLLLPVLMASLLSAASTIIRIYLLFLALPLERVPLLAIVSSTALIAILQALPISFAGIGVRDAVLIAVLARYGYGSALALTLSALYLLINIEHIVVGFLVSLRYPLGRAPADVLGDAAGEQATR
jgi:uncharacterized protein (TIRG00374 family)